MTVQADTLLIDGHNLLFRYFQGMPRSLISPDGTLFHGAYGAIAGILSHIKQFQPRNVIVCFDTPYRTQRSLLLETYKANRPQFAPDDPENPFTQLPFLQKALQLLNIYTIEMPGVEADDLIGSYAQLARNRNQRVMIISTDRDLMQLVDPTTHIYVRRGKKELFYTPELVAETFGVTPAQFIDFKALVGDTSDNIRGVPGIGPKTAASLLQTFGTLETLYANLAQVKPRIATKLREHEELVILNKQIVTIDCRVAVESSWIEQPQTIVPLSARDIFAQLGFFSRMGRDPGDLPVSAD
uniref:5'-3' exonuclease n=1 Tax=Thermosporothrix sp. COM3 TaxID=2490863 RepID=A0A455STX1_9CHLR|nr:hypothetical protein KTC_58270 [Thermosporothrix sp. COM3]